MTSQLSHVFSPIKVGPVTVKNRLMVTAHWHKLVEGDPDGYHLWSVYGERAAHYYAERAKGGFGLIIVGQAVVHPSNGTGRPSGFQKENQPALAKIAGAIHEHGATAFVQINHLGRHRNSGPDDWAPVWASSALPTQGDAGREAVHSQLAKEMEHEDIRSVTEGFAETALNLQRAGFDGVEVHAAHDYLLDEFLSPATNRRTDEYGGSLDNRMRFLFEVLAAIRAACGPGFAVGVRLNGESALPGAMARTLEESVEIARRLAATGNVDFINVTAWPIAAAIGPMGSPKGHLVRLAAAIKAAVEDVAVFTVGRIVDPVHAESIVAEGHADVVGMTRASIADPELPNKAREGRFADIRACIGAGQGCLGSTTGPIACTQNPAAGRERDWGAGTLRPARAKKRVLVVGGGPAGMEAAMIAAQRGHSVVLCDRGDRLGGQVNLFTTIPRRSEFAAVVDWRRQQIERLGIEVKLATDADEDMVASMAADVVVLATGSTPTKEGWTQPRVYTAIPGIDLPHVVTPTDVLLGALDDRKHVVVVDGVGYYQSSDPVEYLAARGSRVDAVTANPMFAAEMMYTERPSFFGQLKDKDVTFHAMTSVTMISESSVTVQESQLGRVTTIENVDGVVMAVGARADDSLYWRLKGRVESLHRIGDCLVPRGVEHAIYEGHKLGREL